MDTNNNIDVDVSKTHSNDTCTNRTCRHRHRGNKYQEPWTIVDGVCAALEVGRGAWVQLLRLADDDYSAANY